jgi:hypothetical protein
MTKIESLKNSSGKIIYSDNCQDIFSLSVEEVKELFKSFGLLVFRGFEVNLEQMKTFSGQFSSQFVRDSCTTFVDEFVRLVDQGMSALGPHCDNASSPHRPDVVWFCCAKPALQGGESLFWDGVRVWEELGEEVKQLFTAKKLCFLTHYSADQWKHFLGSPSATIDDAKRVLDGLKGIKYRINEDQSISLEYVCSAVVKTKYGYQDAFANGLVMDYPQIGMTSYTRTGENVKFEDGSLIPDAAIYEIKQVTDSLTEEILLQTGDLVMVDNLRFMHGRRAFGDSQRQILSLLSNLDF